MQTRLRTALALGVALVASLGTQTARAESPSIEVEYVAPMGTYNGWEYFHVEGLMTGTVEREDDSTGSYAVPVEMVYPKEGGNGLAIAEFPNVAWFATHVDEDGNPVMCRRGEHFCDEGELGGRRLEDQVVRYGEIFLGNHLMREGYTYMAFQWSKLTLDAFGAEPPDRTTRRRLAYGTMEEIADLIAVTRDAASWLRDPEDTTGLDAPAVGGVDDVILFGFSVSGMLARAWMFEGRNDSEEGPFFDAFLIVGAGGLCRATDTAGEVNPCTGVPPTGDALVLSIDVESDLDILFGGLARDPEYGTEDENPNHVRWEVAGAAHLPPAVHGHEFLSEDADANPADFEPTVRAGLHHLARWLTEGQEPPPSEHMAGEQDGTFWTPERDEDGNALGGVRLPHMPRETGEGTIGAPLGVYGGVQWDYWDLDEFILNAEDRNLYIALSGEFTRFSEDRLQELYPAGREDYRERYLAALDAVIEEGYVLEEDRDWYQARAEQSLRSPPEGGEPDAGVDPPPTNGDGGCATFNPASAGGLTALLSILLAAAVRPVIARRLRNEPR